jgi:hypothetical protein
MVAKPDSLGFTRKPPPSTFNYRWDTALADIVTIYAAAVAMSFLPASEVAAALDNLSKKRITWLDDLLARSNPILELHLMLPTFQFNSQSHS